MRPLVVPLVILSLASAGVAHAQVPGDQPGGAPAGGVPTLEQQPSSAIPQQGDEPARAPGSKADSGTVMPPTTANSGTTTTYAPDKAAEEVPWPCAQRKVSTISAGTLWSGPSVDEGKDWDQDNDLAALAQTIASRRTTLEDAGRLIKDFAAKAGADKDKQLTKLFVGVLDIINDSRDQILQGIERYARGQQRLAERISDEADTISQTRNEEQNPAGVAVDEPNRDFSWDKRIFKERKQALSYVCETPSLLEHRAFEISKLIQAQL